MNVSTVVLDLINGYKTYASAILAVASGLGMILAKNYEGGVAEILQALTVVFSGATVVSLRHAVSKVGK
jgi:hypothetical protein